MDKSHSRLIAVPRDFSLGVSAAPVHWAGERAPRHAIIENSLVSVEMDSQGVVVQRQLTQDADGSVRVTSSARSNDQEWFDRIFRPAPIPEEWSDPAISAVAEGVRGLYAFTDGSLFAGILTSIIGQSISLVSAAAVQRRLALSFNPAVEIEGRQMVPLPQPHQLAEAPAEVLRSSGMTWKRAEAIKTIAREHAEGNLPSDDNAIPDRDVTIRTLLALPMVGRWTAESALLWGVGDPDAFPSGDVALLRAARQAYNDDSMSLQDLDALSQRWRPYRGTATRLLWTRLLGTAW